jgi:hypothetical protein
VLNFVKQAVYHIYNCSMRKLRSTDLDFIVLFNKEYEDSKRIGYIVLEYTVKYPVQSDIGIELKFAKQGELKTKVGEAESQLQKYKEGKTYKVVTDACEVKLMYAVFNQSAQNEGDLIKVSDKFVSLDGAISKLKSVFVETVKPMPRSHHW